jgi:hypothetical protein
MEAQHEQVAAAIQTVERDLPAWPTGSSAAASSGKRPPGSAAWLRHGTRWPSVIHRAHLRDHGGFHVQGVASKIRNGRPDQHGAPRADRRVDSPALTIRSKSNLARRNGWVNPSPHCGLAQPPPEEAHPLIPAARPPAPGRRRRTVAGHRTSCASGDPAVDRVGVMVTCPAPSSSRAPYPGERRKSAFVLLIYRNPCTSAPSEGARNRPLGANEPGVLPLTHRRGGAWRRSTWSGTGGRLQPDP